MIFKDLVDTTQINYKLYKLIQPIRYHSEKELKTLLNKLRKIQPDEESNMQLKVVGWYWVNENNGEILYRNNVDALDKRDRKSYAIEFRPWHEWLAMEVLDEDLEYMSKEEFLIHCLEEMTFISDDENEIEKEWNSLLQKRENYIIHMQNKKNK